jgi:hypothetical protein
LCQYNHIDVRVIHVNTVDSSEGKETEVCIVDPTTPARNRNEIGGLTDKLRINVALSRAKNGRVTLGSKFMAELVPNSPGTKTLKEHAVTHKDKTVSIEIGHHLLRPDKYLVFLSKTPASAARK